MSRFHSLSLVPPYRSLLIFSVPNQKKLFHFFPKICLFYIKMVSFSEMRACTSLLTLTLFFLITETSGKWAKCLFCNVRLYLAYIKIIIFIPTAISGYGIYYFNNGSTCMTKTPMPSCPQKSDVSIYASFQLKGRCSIANGPKLSLS